MEIQYDNFDKLIQCHSEIYQVFTPYVCSLIDTDATVGTKDYTWTEGDRDKLYEIDKQLSTLLPDDIYFDVLHEIELNVANIESQAHLIRYLTFIRGRVNTVFELTQGLTEFQSYKLKYWGDASWEMLGEEDPFHPTVLAHKNPATNLRIGYLFYLYRIAELRDQIDSLIHSGKDFTTITPIDYESWPINLRVPKIRGMYHPGNNGKESDVPQDTPVIYKLIVPKLEPINKKVFSDLFLMDFKAHESKFVQILKDLEIITKTGQWKPEREKGIARVFHQEMVEAMVFTNEISVSAAGRIFQDKFGGKLSEMFVKNVGVYANNYRPAISKSINKVLQELQE